MGFLGDMPNNTAGEGTGGTFNLTIPNDGITINQIPEDEDKLKKWLKCNLFVNQMFAEQSYTKEDGTKIVIKTLMESAQEFIKNLDKIVNEFIKTL